MRTKGMAYICFSKFEGAQKAIDGMNSKVIGKRILSVSFSSVPYFALIGSKRNQTNRVNSSQTSNRPRNVYVPPEDITKNVAPTLKILETTPKNPASQQQNSESKCLDKAPKNVGFILRNSGVEQKKFDPTIRKLVNELPHCDNKCEHFDVPSNNDNLKCDNLDLTPTHVIIVEPNFQFNPEILNIEPISIKYNTYKIDYKQENVYAIPINVEFVLPTLYSNLKKLSFEPISVCCKLYKLDSEQENVHPAPRRVESEQQHFDSKPKNLDHEELNFEFQVYQLGSKQANAQATPSKRNFSHPDFHSKFENCSLKPIKVTCRLRILNSKQENVHATPMNVESEQQHFNSEPENLTFEASNTSDTPQNSHVTQRMKYFTSTPHPFDFTLQKQNSRLSELKYMCFLSQSAILTSIKPNFPFKNLTDDIQNLIFACSKLDLVQILLNKRSNESFFLLK